MQRDFKGVWIPKEVWLSEELDIIDKVVLTEITSLDNKETGCYASNSYLASFCNCSERKISSSIAKLSRLKLIDIFKTDGRKRYIHSKIVPSRIF